jgi:glycosyltransferase involved in cell wall biosynthesis
MNNSLSLSFVLPMYNESENIRVTIESIRRIAGALTNDYEMVIVDDASTDNSAEIVEQMSREDDKVKLFRLQKNTKFGGAFAKGFKNAQKEVIVYMDSDLPVSIDDIRNSVPLIRDNDIVTGYSKVKKGDTINRKIMSSVYNLIVQALFGLNVKDINSGYKIVKRKVIDNMIFLSKSPFVDVELFIHAKKHGYKVKQYPLIFLSRASGKSYIARGPVILATFLDMLKVRLFLWAK